MTLRCKILQLKGTISYACSQFIQRDVKMQHEPEEQEANQYSQQWSLDLLFREPIWWSDVQFKTPLTEAADKGAGHQSHACDAKQLQQTLPRHQVIERRHLRQHHACLDADEVVGQEACRSRRGEAWFNYPPVLDQMPIFTVLTNKDWAEEKCDGNVDDGSTHVEKPVGSHGEESQEEQKEEQTILVVLNLEDIRKMVLCACIKV